LLQCFLKYIYSLYTIEIITCNDESHNRIRCGVLTADDFFSVLFFEFLVY
jgi:hypothetical protein